MNTFVIDLSLRPTTFDLWHVSLVAAVVLLAVLLIMVLFGALAAARRAAAKPAQEPVVQVVEKPVVVEKLVEVEKIVEVEKVVPGPAPEPIVLREATPDAALQLLSLLQKEARFVDFVQEDMAGFSDAEIGAAARMVHQGCAKVLKAHVDLAPVSTDAEGHRVTLNKGFDANAFRLTGHIVGEAPFAGTLIHKGWQVTELRLPSLTASHNAKIIAAAEVEL